MNPPRYVAVALNPSDPTTSHEPVLYSRFVRGLLKPDTLRMEALHIAMGLVGETIEFLDAPERKDWIEELGDIEFYFQAALTHHGYTEAGLPACSSEFYCVDDILPHVGDYGDLAKKHHIYMQQKGREDYGIVLAKILAALNYLYESLHIDRQETIQANATKLQARYAKLVFSTEESALRRDKLPPSPT